MAEQDGKMSRRDLFRGAFLRASRAGSASAPRSLTPPDPSANASPGQAPPGRVPTLDASLVALPLLRPPRAVDESSFMVGCTRCNKCIEACPHDAIGLAPPRYRSAAGTPYIEPLAEPCWMCEDTPCVPVCEPGVLLASLPLKMADVMIQEPECIAHQGTLCTVCVEQCPVEGALVLEDGVPLIDQAVCTGCGVCQHVCPAPVNAVLILPLRTRPQGTTPIAPAADGHEARGGDGDGDGDGGGENGADDVPDPLRGRFER